MDAREELTLTQWFSFLERKETREHEWKKLLSKFDKYEILSAFLNMENGELKTVVSFLLEDSYIYFYKEPLYEEAMCVAGKVPREEGGETIL